MRTELFDLGLELDYAREMLKQARIDLADAAQEHPAASEGRLETLRAAVLQREEYLKRVLHDFAQAQCTHLT